MWQIDPKKGPVYQQLAQRVVQKLVQGQWLPGQRLPSTKELASEAMVNPNTMTAAYTRLQELEIIEKKRGKGAYVRDDLDVAKLRQQLLLDYCEQFIIQVKSLGLNQSDAIKALETREDK